MKKFFCAQREESWTLHRLSRVLPQIAIQHLENCLSMPDALLPMLELQACSDHQQRSQQESPVLTSRPASHVVPPPFADGATTAASRESRMKSEQLEAEISEAKRKLEIQQSEVDRYHKTSEHEAMRLRNECIEVKQKLKHMHNEVDQGRNKVKHTQDEVVRLEQMLSASKKKEQELKDERMRVVAQKEQLDEVRHHQEEQLRIEQRETAELREALREKHCSKGCGAAAVVSQPERQVHFDNGRESGEDHAAVEIRQSWQEERSFMNLLQHQNAHLALTVASRERQLSELRATLQQQVLCTELAQQRCGQLEHLICRLRVDARVQTGTLF